ncbi:MAG TPA: hypothetical protein H9815_05930 [Candidatus Ruania gallistercoris]|uniref:Transmembrane protein n=1 Tax=Candidatus Ruania gallistercoris TaxID=2838746 RepID=A0A9D2EDI3_9MICO|nr:hypothetical protein [Candidatus Ruania gallistercoris]
MSEREVVTLLFLAVGIVILSVTIWAWRGRSFTARRWMYRPMGGKITERAVILGGPICGLGSLGLAAIALPPHAFGLAFIGYELAATTRTAGVVLLVLLVLPLLYWFLKFIPLPDVLYPGWAREARAYRRRFPRPSPSQPPHPKDRPDQWGT